MEQRSNQWRHTPICAALTMALLPLGATAQVLATTDPLAFPSEFTFTTVANMQTVIPGSSKTFNSFNQPSVNASGLVVLRGRSTGGEGGGGEGETIALSSGSTEGNKPVRGIYTRQMGTSPGPLTKVFDNSTAVPFPNNTFYNDVLSTFTEFPAFPRIGIESDTVLTRAQAKPVWTWTYIDPETGLEAKTSAGSSGVYAMRLGESVSAMTQLGNVPPTTTYDFSFYAVPGASKTIKFDQFPGAPAVSGWNTVVFKGNYSDGTSKTGIFYRTFSQAAPNARTQLIASSGMPIPGVKNAVFGSTAPPSASDVDVVFLGLDVEEAPTAGAIYKAALAPTPPLKPLVKIGAPVPGEPGARFERLGEALSYDGRFVSFWGGWGGMKTIEVKCPTDGQQAVIDACKAGADRVDGADYWENVQVPFKQGFFAYNVQNGQLYTVAKTGPVYRDFLYWTFSGRPPGVGDSGSEDFEPPRWRSAAFAAAWSVAPKAQVAFKGRRSDTSSQSGYVDGIYLTQVGPSATPGIVTMAETGQPGTLIDPSAVEPDSGLALPITALGIERDGLRNGWFAFAASMANAYGSQAGVYVTRTLK